MPLYETPATVGGWLIFGFAIGIAFMLICIQMRWWWWRFATVSGA